MKTNKIVIAAIVVTIFQAIVGMITCGGVFNWVYTLEPTSVWRPMSGGPEPMYFIGSFALGIIFTTAYAFLKSGIPGKNNIQRGLIYGLCVWAVGMLPGMWATYSFMTVATPVIIYWTILGFIQIPLEGLIVALIYGD